MAIFFVSRSVIQQHLSLQPIQLDHKNITQHTCTVLQVMKILIIKYFDISNEINITY